jgi:hypothetical protein
MAKLLVAIGTTALFLTSGFAAHAQASEAQWPNVDRIVNEMRLPGARETAARTAAALDVILYLTSTPASWGGGGKVKGDPLYREARAKVWGAEKAKYDLECTDESCDASKLLACLKLYSGSAEFTREVVERFLPREKGERLMSIVGGSSHGAWSKAAALPSGTRFVLGDGDRAAFCADGPVTRAKAKEPEPTISPQVAAIPSHAAEPVPADPSVAHTPDRFKSIFGFTLGKALEVPKCPEKGANTTVCWFEPINNILWRVRTFYFDLDPEDFDDSWESREDFKRMALWFPEECPGWTTSGVPTLGRSCPLLATTRNLQLRQLAVQTTNDSQLVLQQLKEKLGGGPTSQSYVMCNGSQSVIYHWNQKGIHVTYQPMDCDLHTFGHVVFETQSFVQERQNAARKQRKKERKL